MIEKYNCLTRGMKLKEDNGVTITVKKYDPFCFINHQPTFQIERDNGWRGNVLADYVLKLFKESTEQDTKEQE